jgi:hypothetical protein
MTGVHTIAASDGGRGIISNIASQRKAKLPPILVPPWLNDVVLC